MSDPSSPSASTARLLPWPAAFATDGGFVRAPAGIVFEPAPAHAELEGEFARMGFATGSPVPGALPAVLRIASAPDGNEEAYALTVSRARVTIDAATARGARHALATLRQLQGADGTLPCCVIRDAPRFPWRGLMLDVARHFLGVAALERTLDAMTFVKLNVLHLHLTDDQGFRFESRAFPRLASPEHYTVTDVAGLVAHAARRGIRIVPEIDMPGHATSWLTAYPQWGSAPVTPTDRFGVHDACLNPANEAVYAAIDTLFGELAEVFPDPLVHVGGDEVNGRWWRTDARVQALMAREGLGDVAAVQAHFLARVAKIAARHGRRLIAWDEALNGGAPANTVIQAWRGATARDRALAAGHACIVSDGYYLDLFLPADLHHASDPAAAASERLTSEDRVFTDPRLAHVAEGMRWTRRWREPAQVPPGATVLGGEACLWSELVGEALLDVRLWSRLPAVADRLWAPAAVRDVHSLYARIDHTLGLLPAVSGVDVRSSSDALLQAAGVATAQLPVVRLLEPVKWYARLLGEVALRARLTGSEMPQARPYGVSTPLDRPVDALLPESLATRALVALLDDEPALRSYLGNVIAIVRANGWLEELRGPVETLAGLCEALLEMLDGGDPAAALRRARAACEPRGEYVIAPAPAIAAWLEKR